MDALRWHGAHDVRLGSAAEPSKPHPGRVCIDVSYCGICGTDLHEFRHGPVMIRTSPHPLTGDTPPITLGHEFSGVVSEIGANVDPSWLGRRVVADPSIRCNRCASCLRGDYHICEKGGSIGLAAAGAFASRVEVAVEQVVPVPDNVDLAVAALAEPLAVGLHAAGRGSVRAGDTVLVLGAGPIGMAALFGALMSGAASVYVSEPHDQRRERALTAGATAVFDPTIDDVRREVFAASGRTGPRVVIDSTGNPDALDLGLRSLQRGGNLVVAGLSDLPLNSAITQLVLYERSIHGALGSRHEIARVLALLATRRIDVSSMITSIRPLSAGPETFAELAESVGDEVKVLLRPEPVHQR